MIKGPLMVLALWPLLIFSGLVPVMAQSAPARYTVYVSFYAYSCSLDNVRVSLYDQSGRLLGSVLSPYGGEVAISFVTLTPAYSLTAMAVGHASLGSYYAWEVSGSRMLALGFGGDYWISIGMH